jgi:hypothetical protein
MTMLRCLPLQYPSLNLTGRPIGSENVVSNGSDIDSHAMFFPTSGFRAASAGLPPVRASVRVVTCVPSGPLESRVFGRVMPMEIAAGAA